MSSIDHQAFFIDGAWRPAQSDDPLPNIISPRSEKVIGHHGVRRRGHLVSASSSWRSGRWLPCCRPVVLRPVAVWSPHGHRRRCGLLVSPPPISGGDLSSSPVASALPLLLSS